MAMVGWFSVQEHRQGLPQPLNSRLVRTTEGLAAGWRIAGSGCQANGKPTGPQSGELVMTGRETCRFQGGRSIGLPISDGISSYVAAKPVDGLRSRPARAVLCLELQRFQSLRLMGLETMNSSLIVRPLNYAAPAVLESSEPHLLRCKCPDTRLVCGHASVGLHPSSGRAWHPPADG